VIKIEENSKVKLHDFLMYWGFILLIFGLLGIIQIGLMDGLSGFIPVGLTLAVIGILILCFVVIIDKKNISNSTK
jgi:hypothetical protein